MKKAFPTIGKASTYEYTQQESSLLLKREVTCLYLFCEQNTPVSFNNSYLPDLSYQIKSSFFISPILLEMSLSCQGFYRKKIRCAEKEQQKKETLTLISTS